MLNNLELWLEEETKSSKDFYIQLKKTKKFNLDIFGTTHSDPAHFIPELIQNADDKNANEAYFNFDTQKSIINFGHNGKNFSKNDILNIVSFGHTEKSTKIDKIGKFGTGFKSVYKVCDKPEIACKLEGENNQSTFIKFAIENKIIPVRQNNININSTKEFQSFATNFFFKLKNAEILTRENFITFIKTNGSKILLFLPNIRKLIFKIDDQKFSFRRHDEDKRDNLKICTIYADDNSNKEKFNYYRFSKKISIEDYEGESELVLAYCFNDKKFVIEKNKCLNVFFSTLEHTGYSFLIHGPFFLDESRNHIDKANKKNLIISEKFEEFIVETIEILKEEKILNISFFKLLPSENDIRYLSNIFPKIKDYLNSAEIWQTDLKTYEFKDNVIYGNEKFRNCFSSEDLQLINIPYKWLEHSNEPNQILYDYLGVKIFDGSFVEDIFEDDYKPNKFLATRSDTQLAQLYLLFLEEKNEYGDVLCKYKNIFKSKDGQFYKGRDLKFSEKNQIHVGINYIHPTFLDNKKFKGKTDDLKIFFMECGVSYVDQNDIINSEIQTLNLKEDEKITINLERYIKFLKNCIKLYNSLSSKRKNDLKEKGDNRLKPEITKDEFIRNLSEKTFLIDSNKIVRTASGLYVDDKCCKTGLSNLENILAKSKIYFPKDSEIKSAIFLKFLREFHIKEKLDIEEKYFSYYHKDRAEYTDRRGQNRTGNYIDEDWDLELFSNLLFTINKKISFLIRDTINKESMEKYCVAKYKPRKTDKKIDKLPSSLLLNLQNFKWIPTRDERFENARSLKIGSFDKKFLNGLDIFWKNKLFDQIKKGEKRSIDALLEECDFSDEDKSIIHEKYDEEPNIIKNFLSSLVAESRFSENKKTRAGKKHAGPIKNSKKKPVWSSIDKKKINKKLSNKSNKNQSRGRNPISSKDMKENYNYHCQICMTKENFDMGTYGEEEKNRRKFIEAAHIKDASASGTGKLFNLLSLCKNCQDKYSEEPNYIMPKIKNTIKTSKCKLKTNSLGFKGYTYEINNGDKVVKIFFQKGHVDIIKKKN